MCMSPDAHTHTHTHSFMWQLFHWAQMSRCQWPRLEGQGRGSEVSRVTWISGLFDQRRRRKKLGGVKRQERSERRWAQSTDLCLTLTHTLHCAFLCYTQEICYKATILAKERSFGFSFIPRINKNKQWKLKNKRTTIAVLSVWVFFFFNRMKQTVRVYLLIKHRL